MDLVNIVNEDVWPKEGPSYTIRGNEFQVNCACMKCFEDSVFESRFHLPVCEQCVDVINSLPFEEGEKEIEKLWERFSLIKKNNPTWYK